MHKTVVSTATLAESLDAGWAIIDCRFDLQHEDWGADQYRAGHIPSAVHAHLTHHLSGDRTGANGRHPLPPVDSMVRSFSQFGIDRATQVVVYDQDAGMFASRLWWMLRYLGHDAVAVLDGGWTRWVNEGRPIRSGNESRPAARFEATVRPERIASIADVEALSRGRDGLLVDARAPERFEGRSEPLDRAAGHIPGAVNHFFRRNANPDGTMLAPAMLRDQFSGVLEGHAPGRIVLYCGSGVTACHNLLAMEYAGLPGARLYPGSWSEWSADPERPVETGPRVTR